MKTKTKPPARPHPAESLYSLTASMIRIVDCLEETGGEIDAETEILLRELATDLPAKVDGYRRIMAQFERRARARKDEADRLKALAAQDARAFDRLKEKLREALELAGERKIVTDLFSVSICQNPKPTIRWTGRETDIPPAFKRVVESLDGDAALEYLKTIGPLPEGFEVEYGTHLRLG